MTADPILPRTAMLKHVTRNDNHAAATTGVAMASSGLFAFFGYVFTDPTEGARTLI